MGRFSWGASAKNRDMRVSRKDIPTSPVQEEAEAAKSGDYSTKGTLPKYVWVLGLFVTALFAYSIEVTPARISNAIWFNHLFSEYRPPRRTHMNLTHSRKSFLSKTVRDPIDLWSPPPDNGWKPCLIHTDFESGSDNGYLQVMCSGGLFQIHICVCNAVAVAKLVNATLLIPYFRKSLVWKDPSQFGDIYDTDHFIAYFEKDLRIVRQLPEEYAWSVPDLYAERCLERPNCLTYVRKHSTMNWYLEKVPPLLQTHGVAVLDGPTQYSGWDHKLTFEGLPVHITQLRCRANFEGLQFVPAIQEFGKLLVNRIRAKSLAVQSPNLAPQMTAPQPWWSTQNNEETLSGSEMLSGNSGDQVHRYLGLHVRFEKDMIAHSACYYGGGRAEKRALAAFRAKIWRGGVSKTRYKPEALRMNGSCPLTPDEMGLLLSGLGFPISTPVYMASKNLYGGVARIKPLKEIFPILESKYTLASTKELRPFLPYSHKLAALDFLVLLNSDVFMSNAAGNFPNVLSGQRTFYGPRKSIHADKRLLAHLFSKSSISWLEFSSQVTEGHLSRLGSPVRRMPKYSIFRYPAPDCMCQEPKQAVG
ncbi:O-fucosyltransferase 39 isoform X1 [Physcomitrium patens]|uniref:O-fucosyltransferase family protein n=1 Tax=Physcomitrium patens TaxID=3218 RepID=A0A2K1JUZ6_PHYPA|nr:O-fucosyltransferase 39-like isoform X1 [Physcomitrium patens]PNR45340.1 hypothetical protein PHYPA_015111 [Physcomitrium patens]|eukprot:XP_024389122.1 O-fucosyltransferase 39-like isoform X1 [Physcomitrella patens]